MKNLITMKTVHCFFLTAAVFALAGCGKEILPSDSNGSNNNNGEGGSSGVSDATTIAVTDEEEDLIANTSFVRTISIVFSDTGGATVSGDVIGIVTVVDNQVTIDNRLSSEKVKYELSGTTSNGFLKIYSNNKQALVLNGLSITNPNGAAINNQGKKRCFVVVNGQNYLADGATYTATPDDEDEKAAFFSEGQLIFSGDGSLTVKASGKAGITSDDYIHFLDAPVVEVSSSAGHAIRGKDAVIVSGGTIDAFTSADMKKAMCSDSLVLLNGGVTTVKVTGGTAYDSEDKDYKAAAGVKADQLFIMNAGTLTATSTGSGGKGISGDGPAYFQGGTVKVTVTGSNYGSSSSKNSTSAKGIKFDGDIYISDGTIEAVASNHEAIESKGKIEIAGGTVYAQSRDDAINSAGMMAIIGGNVCAYSTNNDGMDANGNMYIEGGVVYAVGCGGAEVALDANTEGGYQLYVNGGTLFAIGGLENGASLSQACYQASSWSKNTWYGLTVGETTYAFKTPSSGGTGLVVSGSSQPGLFSGVSVSGGTSAFNGMAAFGASVSGGTSVSLSSYTSGSGMGGPGGGGFPGGGPGGW